MTDNGQQIQGDLLRIFKGAEAEQYACRAQAQSDTAFCLECLLRAQHELKQSKADNILCQALVSSALVRFFTIFDGPGAIRWTDLVKKLPDGAADAYVFYRNYRSKHITHKVNPADQIKVGVLLGASETGEAEVQAIAHLEMHDVSHTDAQFIQSFGDFIHAIHTVLQEETRDWQSRALEAAQTLGTEKLMQSPALRLVVPSKAYLTKSSARQA